MAAPRPPVNKYAVILFVGIVIVGLLLFTSSSSSPTVTNGFSFEPLTGSPVVITTEDVVAGQYYGKGSNSTWIDDNMLSWIARGTGDLITYNTNDKGKRVVIKAGQFITRPWKTKFSRNLANVLVAFNPQRLFRSTILARYVVHDGDNGELIKELKTDDNLPEQMFQLGVWSNDNNTIFVVYKNDLYGIKVKGEAGGLTKRFTADGSETIFNGIADWVFEEEIFVSTSTCVYSSPTGAYVAYMKFNDSVVEPINYNLYGDYSGEPYFDEYYQYPKFGTVRYPKSGRRNPTVSIHVVNVGDPTCWSTPTHAIPTQQPTPCTWDIPLNALMSLLTQTHDNFIVGQFNWLDSSPSQPKFSMLTFNRIQNKSWILECSFTTRECKIVRSNVQSHGWIDNAPLFHHNDEYVTLSSVPQSDNLQYMHVGGFTNELVRMYTRGYFSVDEIVQISEIGGKDTLIFKAPLLNIGKDNVTIEDVAQAHYYALRLGNQINSPVCLTCYGDCTYNTAKFKGSQFVNVCERQHLVSNIYVAQVTGDLGVNLLEKLEENKGLQALLDGVQLPEVDYLKVPYKLNGKQYFLSVKTIGPRGWREGGFKKYSVVVDTYSGPNSQKVNRRLTPNDWSYALASNPNYPVVYVIIDGIGSGRQSSSLAFEVYRNLGDKEIFDKVYAMKYLLKEYKSLDPMRTLIWGWSYGGYVSAMSMGKDTEKVFKCGISVAPVVNWYYYDTMYTERYMSTPKDNPVGYNSSNVLRYVDNFEGKKYLLVHGNADDNVHYQQSMVLARALEQKAILFRMMSYPDENHSLGGVRQHLFRTLEDFVFNTCFRRI